MTSDDSALIALSDTEESGEIIRQNGQGELVIDFTANGSADGVNPNSRYQIGEVEANEAATDPVYNDLFSQTPYDKPAFNVKNQSSEEREVKLEYTTDSVDEDTNS
ncbi:hypothetical protein EXE41_18820, partial [Halorubrum sp. SD690R]|uniref:hypothetical protein n=1 Tax=Halorubrum sp. SD690R TaxID=2518117 RepID=UPI0010F8770F